MEVSQWGAMHKMETAEIKLPCQGEASLFVSFRLYFTHSFYMFYTLTHGIAATIIRRTDRPRRRLDQQFQLPAGDSVLLRLKWSLLDGEAPNKIRDEWREEWKDDVPGSVAAG